jgi:hypothetical protein
MPSYRDCAVVYVAWTRACAEESLVSAESARRAMPDIAIYLKVGGSITSTASLAAMGKRWSVFDRVVRVRDMEATFADKFRFLAGVEEEKVLYLDTDTYVVSGLREAFDLLGRFDMACAHAPCRFADEFRPDDPRLPRVPMAFPELNSGVIFCRNSIKVRRLFRTCREIHAGWASRGKHTPDQPALRCALWESRISFSVLPPEYNARLCFPAFLSGEAKILHSRFGDLRKVARVANASLEPRTFQPEEFGE